MPLNNHPSAKPTYDFYDTVPPARRRSRTASSSRSTVNLPDANFPGGSTTWHWHSPEGDRALPRREQRRLVRPERRASRRAGSSTTRRRTRDRRRTGQQANKAIMDKQEDITNFQSALQRAVPVHDRRRRHRRPERRASKRRCRRRSRSPAGRSTSDTFHHENMHQWWGDNVSEANYNLTFFKEGSRRSASTSSTRRGTRRRPARRVERGVRAEPRRHVQHELRGHAICCGRARRPTRARTRCSRGRRRTRDPGIAYIALRQILGPANFNAALQQIQRDVPPGEHHRAAARSGVRLVPARGRPRRAARSSASSSPSGGTPSIRPAAARTGRRSPGPASTAAASIADRRRRSELRKGAAQRAAPLVRADGILIRTLPAGVRGGAANRIP